MILQQVCRKHKFFLFMILCLGWVSPLKAQQFDQAYQQWKTQQQLRDQQLANQANNNYYLSRPTQQAPQRLSSSVNIPGDKISLNQASLQQLQMLNGVGEKKAQAIMEYRQKNGGFKSVDELMNIKGIGPKLLEKNKARLML